MHTSNHSSLLGNILKNVSRSFFLTLRVLPKGLREPIGLAYLLARTADSIADTPLVSSEHRLEALLLFRSSINGAEDGSHLTRLLHTEITQQQLNPHEQTLLASINPMLNLLAAQNEHDREAICQVVTTLTKAMEFDLCFFPSQHFDQITALKSLNELDHYTYLIAGCVGEFWTHMTYRYKSEVRHWNIENMSHHGIRFGKALQMTNILRDCGKDLRIGRCYLPTDVLNQFDLCPKDLLHAEPSLKTKPLLIHLVELTLEHFHSALNYILAIPVRCIRLRLACLWPIIIGLETILLLVHNDHWLDPQHPSKIKRSKIYYIMIRSLLVIGSNTLVRIWIEQLMAKIKYKEIINPE